MSIQSTAPVSERSAVVCAHCAATGPQGARRGGPSSALNALDGPPAARAAPAGTDRLRPWARLWLALDRVTSPVRPGRHEGLQDLDAILAEIGTGGLAGPIAAKHQAQMRGGVLPSGQNGFGL